MDGKPEKLFYTIAEVSSITGIKPYILRYWEAEFDKLKPERENKRRQYRKEDIDLIFKIKKMLYEERLHIDGARIRLKAKDGSRETEKLKIEIAQLRAELIQLKSEGSIKKNTKEEIARLKEQLKNLLNLIKK